MPRDFIDGINTVKGEFQKMMQGKFKDIDMNEAKPFFSMIAKHVAIQKKRIGGNFVVAHAVNSREIRNHIRQIIPNVIFVTLTLTRGTQMERIQARHGEQSEAAIKMLTGLYDIYELPGENEKNTFNVDINEEMAPADVVKNVQNIISDHFKMDDLENLPWKSGYYCKNNESAFLLKVDKENFTTCSIISFDFPDIDMGPQEHGSFTLGNFGPASNEVVLASGGIKNYNIEFTYMGGISKAFGVVSNDGKHIYKLGLSEKIDHLEWLSDEALEKLLNDRDPVEAPSCPYKIQPENQVTTYLLQKI